MDGTHAGDSENRSTMTSILITGSRGFIAGHLREYINCNTDWEIISEERFFSSHPNYVVHLGGNSQIDKSIKDSRLVSRDIETTITLLGWARTQPQLRKLLYFSSDEVFGPKEVIMDFNPWDRYNSHSPYAAGKAACEELCLAWASTYGVPAVITHCQNLIGERQPANKFLPSIVRAALQGQPVSIYADGCALPKRNFLHVRDACSAIVLLLEQGKIRDKYNITSQFEITNGTLVDAVAQILQIEIKVEKRTAESVRPGFFVDHGLNGAKLEELGWKRMPLMQSLSQTVLWMAAKENRHWLGL
jgi:dTDP-glucose 4,6-dehydratase